MTRRGVPAERLVAVGRNDVANLAPSIGDASPNRRVEFEIGFNGETQAMNRRKIMLLGDIGVGKSSIVRRLVFDAFDQTTIRRSASTSTAARSRPTRAADAPPAKFVIWDTDGNFGDSILSLVYIRQAAAALVVGDLTRPATIETMLELGRNFSDRQCPAATAAFC